MIKKIFFLLLLSLTIISLGCNVYDEIIDAAIVDQASPDADENLTSITSSDDLTTDSSASGTSSLIIVPSKSSLAFPP